jgi:hypothetical protein
MRKTSISRQVHYHMLIAAHRFFLVPTAEQLQSHVSQGHCVSLAKPSVWYCYSRRQAIQVIEMIRTFDVDNL